MGEPVVFWKRTISGERRGKKEKKEKKKRADGNCIWIIDVWTTFFSAPLTAFNSNGWVNDNTYSKFNITLTFNTMISPGLEELEEFQFHFSIFLKQGSQGWEAAWLWWCFRLWWTNSPTSSSGQSCCSVSAYPGWPAAGWWWQRRRSQPSSGCLAPAESNPLVLDQNCPASSPLYSCPSLTWKTHTNINISHANLKLNVCKLLVAPVKTWWKRYM